LHCNRCDQLLVINKTLLFVQDSIWKGYSLLVVMWRLARFSILLEDTYVYTNVAHKKVKVIVVDEVIHSGKNTCNSGGFM